MSGHTKGPWRYQVTLNNGKPWGGIVWGPKVSVSSTANPLPHDDMRLIAAAPDLLEALIVLHDRSLNYADGSFHAELGEARTKAATAIAKATQP